MSSFRWERAKRDRPARGSAKHGVPVMLEEPPEIIPVEDTEEAGYVISAIAERMFPELSRLLDLPPSEFSQGDEIEMQRAYAVATAVFLAR